MNLNLTESELQSLVGLIDAGVRATGLRAVKDAANLIEKIEAAQQPQQLVGDEDDSDQ